MDSDVGFDGLTADIKRLLADALDVEGRHAADIVRRDELHLSEIDRRNERHHAELNLRSEQHHVEIERRQSLHQQEMDTFREALETRNVIGQAQGIIMATMSCTAGEAFAMIRKQSNHQNVKVIDIALEITSRAARNHRPSTGGVF